MAIVVDTDVFSYIFKKDTRAAAYETHLIESPKFISFMTLAELRLWQVRSNWGERKRSEFDLMISDYGIIFPDENLCTVWAQIQAESGDAGMPISTSDAWVAAVAVMFELPLVTHNKKHFGHLSDLVLL